MNFTRRQYINKECTHNEYYSQFVNEGTKKTLLQYISLARLKQSKDEHFNDIPLKEWDNLPVMVSSTLMIKRGDWMTLAGKVCIYKTCARNILNEL